MGRGGSNPPSDTIVSREDGASVLALLIASETPHLPVVCPETIDWVAVGLGATGGCLALVAAILGIRMKAVPQSARTAQWVQGPELIISEIDRVIRELRAVSWVLLLASLIVLSGVGVQIVQLVSRC
jgi:predicted membrane channel-forming protein YqfA (hemolysin III family)